MEFKEDRDDILKGVSITIGCVLALCVICLSVMYRETLYDCIMLNRRNFSLVISIKERSMHSCVQQDVQPVVMLPVLKDSGNWR